MRFGFDGTNYDSAEMIEVRTPSDYEPILYVPQTKDAVFIVRFDREGVRVVRASQQEILDLAMRYEFPVLKEVVEILSRVESRI